ncbi:hypothetical protein SAY87_007711 [Trapa incisa]|uniref:Mediator of RNA polymerase II transcription subunit 25 n=1 Tax=Trapa incisa TaxID=236973 RepID=A0AAN7QFL1_9MYRT|nr:hypothetical protein SAY87_007711 [Trapa incisa]
MAEKQLIVAVEGTAAMGPYWKTVISDYLEKIIRSFAGNDSIGQKTTSVNVELSLIMFTSHGSYSASLVQRSGWTRDVDIFLQWLLAIPFGGGGFNDAAIAEGLAEALMMFSAVPNGTQTQQTMEGKRHCILIAASNPYPLPTPIYRPKFQNLENDHIEPQAESCLSDAEAVAKSFPQGLVSLSVICPKQLPKVKAIYSSAKRFPQAPDPPVDNTRNPQFLVMISENFMEARAALSRPGISTLPSHQSTLKMDMPPVIPVTVQNQPSIRAANGSMMNRPPVSVGNGPAIVKVEPTTITSVPAPASSFPHMPRPVSQGVPTLQTSSPPSVVSQDVTANSDCTQDLKPVVSGTISQPLRPGGPANSNILNNLSQVRQVVNSAALSVGTSIGLPTISQNPMAMHMSNMISSSGMQSSVPPSSAAQNLYSISGSFPTATSSISGNSSGISQQPTGNFQGMGQGNLAGGSQMVSSGMGMNQNIMTSSGAGSGAGAGAGTGTMIPTPGVAPSGMQSLGGGNNANPGASIPLSQQSSSSLQTVQSKYVKVWEGNLSGQRQGQPVFITRLEGYRNSSASETLAANWPPTMQIVRLISQDHMNNKQYVGKADFLVFRAMNQHGFLVQLQEKKLCAVIQLPSQTLLLSVSDKAYRLIGMLFPGDMVVFKPQNNQQQQPQQMLTQQHPQMQQHQQQQLPQLQPQQQIPQLQQQQQLPQLQQQQQQQIPQLQQQQQQVPQLQQQPQMTQQQQQQQQLPQMTQQQQQQQQQIPQLQQQHMTQQQQQIPQLQQHMTQQQQQMTQLQQQQLSQIQQQQQLSQIQQQQQLQQLQQQRPQQQNVGTGMGQGYVQGPNRSQLVVPQGQMSSQVPPTMPGSGFMS